MKLLDERIDQYEGIGWTVGPRVAHDYIQRVQLGRRSISRGG